MFAVVQLSAAAIAALVVAAPSAAWAASPALTVAEVRELVAKPGCGGVRDDTPEGVALRERMVAKLRHESGLRGTDLLHPYAIRDETEGRAVKPVPATYEAAVAEAERRLALGHVIGVGLGQITWTKNLLADFEVPDIAVAVRLAFRPCAAVRAAVRHYAADIAAVGRVLDCASAAYNAGPGRVCQDTPYVRSVRALQAALPAAGSGAVAPSSPRAPARRASPPAATVEVLLPLPADPGTTNREAAP